MGTNTNRNRGKRLERFVAKATGGKRIGILGDVDVITKDTIIECKSRNRCEVDKFMRQVEKHQNKYPDHTPVVWIHITGTQHTEDIICIRAKHTINNIPEED